MRKSFVLLILLLVCFPLMSRAAEGQGCGTTVSEARTEAAAELSRYLYTMVDTTVITTLSDSGNGVEASFYQGTQVSSNMPLLGVTYNDRYTGGIWTSTARIDSEKSLPLYFEALDPVVADLVMPDLTGIGSAEAAALLNAVLERFDEYRKLRYVVSALGGSYEKQPSVTEAEIRSVLIRVNGTVDSLAKAASILTAGCAYDGIYVELPLPAADNVASDFSIIFADALKSRLGGKTVGTMQAAGYFLNTRYSEDSSGDLFVVAELSDRSGRGVFSSSVTVPAFLVRGLSLYADGYEFRKSQNSGQSVINDLRIFIRINGGSGSGTFRVGDELFVEVKASQPCSFYIVGYVFDEEGNEFSYLFPVSAGQTGNDLFVGRIGSENVGRWVVINPSVNGYVIPLEIEPPLGVETLQVYASTTDDYTEFLSRIPAWTETEEFFVITGEPQQVLSKTRALNIKKAASAARAVSCAEASVTYRSVR
ncbi:MAG: DUF4384 domain-containing protein [Spirochaetales bacterium]|nr:DUF4384 domain-containing protein [Spirochaetales bacterium]